MSVTVVREDDQPTRHPWYRIPATVEIEDWRYPIREWSLEGFSVVGVDEPVTSGQSFPARLIFRFDGFSTIVDVSAEVVRRDDEDDGLTCRFNDLSRQKVAVLRAVIDSYLLGEFVAMDDVIHVVRRDSPVDLSHQDEQGAPVGAANQLRVVMRRWAGLSLVSVLLVSLLAVSAWAGYRRLYVAESIAAVVTGPLIIVRAPQASFFSSTLPREVEAVERKVPLAYVELVDGGTTTIDSPCDCHILRRHVLDGEFIATGEPLFTLLPRGQRVHVNAKVPVEQARNIAIGDVAKVTLPDRSIHAGYVSHVLYAEPPERALSAPLSRARSDAISFYEVVIATNEPLDRSQIGVATSVEINTYRGPGSGRRD